MTRQLVTRLSNDRWWGSWLFLGGLALLPLAALPLMAQAPATLPAGPASPLDGRQIRQLTITGLRKVDEAYVRNRIRTRAGDAYSQDQVERDRGQLLRTGRFLDVKADPVLVDGQINLTFSLVEKPEVEALDIVGNQKIKTKDLLKELSFSAGDPLDMHEVRQGRDTIERLYREKGYPYVSVTYDENLLATERRVVYTVVENQRVKIRKVRFENNVTYDAGELMRQIETKSYIPIFRTGNFDADQAARDAATLQKYYRDRGFLDAEVGYVTEFQDVAREKLDVVFRVNEGVRYTVAEIRVQGNQVFTTDELLNEMNLSTGDPLVDARLKSDVKRLETKYGSQGYIDVKVASSWVFASEPAKVILTLNIQEGEQFTVGWIEVDGNERTQEKCIRREVGLYPGDIYDVTKMTKAEQDLKATGLFIGATVEAVEPSTPQPGVRDMRVTVEENTKTTNFIAGLGASSDSGLLGNIVLENTNFDLFDTPRTWDELFKGRAFKGAGQTMRVQFEPGTEYTRFRIDFREPYLNDRPIGFNTGIFLFERPRDAYTEQRAGVYVSFDKKFEEGLLKGWLGEIALRPEYVNVDDVERFSARDIQKVKGGSYLSTIKFSLVHDTTDSRLDPGKGHRANLSWEQAGVMGGDYTHSKLTAGYTQYWTVAIDEQDRKSVVSARANIGQILGDAPVFERFYAGGIGSMRGFDFRGISPRSGLKKDRVGGEFMLLTGGEYSFPMYDKVIRGVLFTDMGTVERDFGISSWRASVGCGIRLTLEIFGTVPMEFDLAWPVIKDSEDDTRVFNFFIGLPFF
ncbi:MAG: outer membrane protein assembly factor BamA [Phycisphaerae bacterium]